MADLCPGCFERERPSGPEACPRCGYTPGQERSPLALPTGTDLKGRYVAGRLLGAPGGFGITYLAYDHFRDERAAVKEYVPREMAGRDADGRSIVPHSSQEQEQFEFGLERFLREAKTLGRFDHANVVTARDFFEAHGTAYLVMDYYEGKTLKQYLSEQPDGKMDPEAATEIMLRVLDGLWEVHAKEYLHRDVKPENIYLTTEGRPILIDFGAARQAMGERSQSLSVVMTPGYAPYEQYRREGDQGPWTDVYGCGATLYRMLTGQKPPAATDRIVDDTLEPPYRVNPQVPEALSEAIVEALAPGNKERLSSVEDLQEQLREGESNEAPEQQEASERSQETEGRAERNAETTPDSSNLTPGPVYRSRISSESGTQVHAREYVEKESNTEKRIGWGQLSEVPSLLCWHLE